MFNEDPSNFSLAKSYLVRGKKPYVAGFLFDENLNRVVLIRKTKPEYQKGKLNGVGGKVGDHNSEESPDDATRREFLEETGMSVSNWRRFLILNTEHSTISFYWAVGCVENATTMTEEMISVYDVSDVINRMDIMPNLRWCVQMASSFAFGERSKEFDATEVL
jgi:8-oxo-dGTP diphosphatase